ncbi:MAG: hypothetical protein KDD62_12070, partial [Bdellovibrionales bacterium]|nr:hypothetical protein [Bdellovibrionales bacterium]
MKFVVADSNPVNRQDSSSPNYQLDKRAIRSAEDLGRFIDEGNKQLEERFSDFRQVFVNRQIRRLQSLIKVAPSETTCQKALAIALESEEDKVTNIALPLIITHSNAPLVTKDLRVGCFLLGALDSPDVAVREEAIKAYGRLLDQGVKPEVPAIRKLKLLSLKKEGELARELINELRAKQ